VPTAVVLSTIQTAIYIKLNCNPQCEAWGELECKWEGGMSGWRNLHEEGPDDLHSWRNRTGLMK